ncbi:MAG: MBL fold metallo-hydrolase [Endomicrobiales bacterium]|nr:MBL fold metallo-hydrolase [Endomicrobiales bacterium]
MDKFFAVEIAIVGNLATNCYIVYEPSSGSGVVIDPGAEAEFIIKKIEAKKIKPRAIINTHAHADHIEANAKIKKKYKIPIYVHRSDAVMLRDEIMNGSMLVGEAFKSPEADVLIEHGDKISVGNLSFEVFHTPGHSAGGICLYIGNTLFTGDTLFKETVGRWDLPGGDEKALMRSLRTFDSFPKETVILPGHGEASTLDYEYAHNPFFEKRRR